MFENKEIILAGYESQNSLTQDKIQTFAVQKIDIFPVQIHKLSYQNQIKWVFA